MARLWSTFHYFLVKSCKLFNGFNKFWNPLHLFFWNFWASTFFYIRSWLFSLPGLQQFIIVFKEKFYMLGLAIVSLKNNSALIFLIKIDFQQWINLKRTLRVSDAPLEYLPDISLIMTGKFSVLTKGVLCVMLMVVAVSNTKCINFHSMYEHNAVIFETLNWEKIFCSVSAVCI